MLSKLTECESFLFCTKVIHSNEQKIDFYKIWVFCLACNLYKVFIIEISQCFIIKCT